MIGSSESKQKKKIKKMQTTDCKLRFWRQFDLFLVERTIKGSWFHIEMDNLWSFVFQFGALILSFVRFISDIAIESGDKKNVLARYAEQRKYGH